MEQGEKQLLLVDLSARLPYKLWIHFEYEGKLTTINEDRFLDFEDVETLKYTIENPESDGYAKISWKPYLRSLSSMTEEEKKEYKHLVAFSGSPNGAADFINWLNAHHFDYRGLIPMGLAIEITKDNNPYDRKTKGII